VRRLGSKPDLLIEKRRERVAELSLKGLTTREIAEIIGKTIPNPRGGNAWGKTIIGKDLAAVREDWQRRAAEHIGALRAQQLAKIDHVEREGWIARNLDIVLKALKMRADLLGLNAPKEHNINANVATIAQVDLSTLTIEELRALRNVNQKLIKNDKE